MKHLERFHSILLIGGVGFFLLSFVGMGLAPWTTLKRQEPPKDWPKRTAMEERGRDIYMHEGCWHCHSQFVRPIGGESLRYGPTSKAMEYLDELPQLFGTRRVGPDLAREAGKRSDDWHLAHLYQPRSTTPWSIMPGLPWLFTQDGDRLTPSDDARALVAYLQSLGRRANAEVAAAEKTYRDHFAVGNAPVKTVALLERGDALFRRECQGCHGEQGDGQGRATPFLTPAAANFRVVRPTPEYVYRTLHIGIPGSSMPQFREYTSQDLWALAYYVTSLSEAETLAPALDAAAHASGASLFQAQCMACHGATGHGDGPAASAFQPAPPDFHGLRPTQQRVLTALEHGVPGTAMAPFPQLSSDEKATLAGYIETLWRNEAVR